MWYLWRLPPVLLQRVDVQGQLQPRQIFTQRKREFLRWTEGKHRQTGIHSEMSDDDDEEEEGEADVPYDQQIFLYGSIMYNLSFANECMFYLWTLVNLIL